MPFCINSTSILVGMRCMKILIRIDFFSVIVEECHGEKKGVRGNVKCARGPPVSARPVMMRDIILSVKLKSNTACLS